jgi:hypothetical protein
MKLSETQTTSPLIKLILMGVSGSGKSSAIIPLAIPNITTNFPGYELRVLDFDGKFQEIALAQLNARKDRAKARRADITPITEEQYNSAMSNIDIAVCREKAKIISEGTKNKMGIQSATAWDTALKAIKAWQPTLTEKTILIIDSLTHMATIAVANYTQSLNSKLNRKLEWRDFLPAQQEVQMAMQVFSDLPCHTIITGHQGPLDIKKKTGETRELPNGTKEEIEEVVDSLMLPLSVGSAGRISIPSQLNHLLVIADNINGIRQIYTKPHNGVVTKSPFFALSDPAYPLDVGLPKYFELANI